MIKDIQVNPRLTRLAFVLGCFAAGVVLLLGTPGINQAPSQAASDPNGHAAGGVAPQSVAATDYPLEAKIDRATGEATQRGGGGKPTARMRGLLAAIPAPPGDIGFDERSAVSFDEKHILATRRTVATPEVTMATYLRDLTAAGWRPTRGGIERTLSDPKRDGTRFEVQSLQLTRGRDSLDISSVRSDVKDPAHFKTIVHIEMRAP